MEEPLVLAIILVLEYKSRCVGHTTLMTQSTGHKNKLVSAFYKHFPTQTGAINFNVLRVHVFREAAILDSLIL